MMHLEHAPAGGERFIGRFYKGGEFLPFYIPRDVMPQVDEADYPELLDFLASRGVRVERLEFDPWKMHVHQRISFDRSINMPDEVLRKPVLASREPYVVDGNHRWLGHVIRNTLVPTIKIDLPFDNAIETVKAFPKTYAYGDGNFHPVRN